MPPAHVFIFATVLTTVLAPTHYYVWRRFIRDSKLPPTWHRLLSGLMVLLLLSQPVNFIFSRSLPRHLASPFAFAAFVWLGLLSTYFVLLVPSDLVRLAIERLRRVKQEDGTTEKSSEHAHDTEKRSTLKRLMTGGALLTGTGIGAAAVDKALKGFQIRNVEILLDKLPHAFDGFTIAQLSDIHVGPTLGRQFVQSMVDATNELKPDLIAITGDLVDGSVSHLGQHTAPLEQLRSPHGSFFVTGNHEYYSGVEEWVQEVSRLGITNLRNQYKKIVRGKDSFILAGVTDFRGGRYGDPPDLASALRQRKSNEEVVLMAHQPREIKEAERLDVGLQLSGHTHGGQFWPWNWVIHLIEPVVSGWARFGRTQIYVNSGTGYWGPPMRMGTQSEITLITLRSKAKARDAG